MRATVDENLGYSGNEGSVERDGQENVGPTQLNVRMCARSGGVVFEYEGCGTAYMCLVP